MIKVHDFTRYRVKNLANFINGEISSGLIIVLDNRKIMKQLLILGLSAGILLTACNQHRYVDLTSGSHIDLEKDENGNMVDSKTHKPVYMYVDTKTHDTIYGSTGAVINGHVVKTEDGKYKYDGDGDYKYKNGDYKVKVEGDEVKISFAECPAPVKATLNKESGNAKIDTVDKETDEGKTIYEADVMIDGQNYEIKVAEDGKLISKKMDNEEGEKKGDKKGEKEEDEKNEKK